MNIIEVEPSPAMGSKSCRVIRQLEQAHVRGQRRARSGEQRVAVGLRLGDELRRDDALGAGLVVITGWPSDFCSATASGRTRLSVALPAEADDDGDRAVRIVLRGAGKRQQGEWQARKPARCSDSGLRSIRFHALSRLT
jgi:hypothetical protein